MADNDVPQLRLTPRAAHLVVAQRGRQGVGFAVKTSLLLAKAASAMPQTE